MTIFAGSSVLALHTDNLHDAKTLKDAKRLLRLALQPLVGARPFMSRTLFKRPTEEHNE